MAAAPRSPGSADSAYRRGLAWLARRELSHAQVRRRLARGGFDPAAIDEAVARLAGERSLDDVRTAGAIARTGVALHGHGPIRIRRSLAAAGIDPAVAERAIDEAFAGQDVDELLERALTRRLRGRDTMGDDRERQRLYRYLVAQGFEPDRVLARLRAGRT